VYLILIFNKLFGLQNIKKNVKYQPSKENVKLRVFDCVLYFSN